ncbi:hypothetical protein [Bacillus mycoides]|uniref:Uncharacterized protein n=1 Tax=Bacillus mycoides (strain KBAB4) TaxID=315730 RepID=A9VVG5_BACMK|nr:hypothetical protein [Bacillus mycoides]ABY46780.1 hypothetical protein BcerKBAB4_5285 [Bacillus mycoides KBAB4]
MKQTIFIAVDKESGKLIMGARGQMAFDNSATLSRSLGQAGNLKGTYDVHEINPLRLIPQGKFEINILEGKNWNGESRIEFDSPAGSFSCGSLSECPEDATLERDLSFVHDIDSMMRKAHEAGIRGDAFVVNYEDEDEEE